MIVPRRSLCSGAKSYLPTVEGLTLATGTVKWFNTTKGYGFIVPEDGQKDVFVHISAVEKAGLRTLTEGQRVTFDVATERGRPAAVNIQAG
jgi:CspA family cold shock protein